MSTAKTTHINFGIRKILETPFVYNLFQTLVGSYKEKKQHFKEYIQAKPNDNILDIGCGTAILLDALPDTVNYVGYDMEEEYIEHAQKKYGSRGTFYCERVGARIEEKWINHFDIINAHGLLHHLSDGDSKELLKIAHLYLKKGGYLVTADTVYHAQQSKLEHWLVSKDRGQNIRTPEQYLSLAHKYFDKVEGKVYQDMYRIPYSIYKMRLEK